VALNKHRNLEHFSLAARSMPQSTVSQYKSDEDSTESSSLSLPL